MDRRITFDLNRLSFHLRSLHQVWAPLVHFGLPAVLVVLLVLGAAETLRSGIGAEERPRRRVVLVALPAAALSYLVAALVAAAVARAAPAGSLPGVVVLVHDGHSSLPDPVAALVGALATGLVRGRTGVLALLGTLVALVEALALVAFGAAYVTDVIAGLALGVLLTTACVSVLNLAASGSSSPRTRTLVSGVGSVGPVLGPASRPRPFAPSGSVTVLSDQTIRPRGHVAEREPAGPVVSSS